MFKAPQFGPEVSIREGSLSHLITKLLQVHSANSTNFSNPIWGGTWSSPAVVILTIVLV